MTKRTIFKAMAIVLTLPLFFSCSKDSVEGSNPIVEEQGITLAESEATRLSVKNLMESSQNISLADFVTEAKKLKNIKDAIIEDSLVYLTTTAGGSICVDLYGSSLRKQDYEEYSVDTCGTYIQNYIDAIEEQYKDSISDGVEYDPIEGDSIDVSYGDEEDVITTRAKLHHRKILNKRRIAIWEPWDEFANYDISPFISIVQNSQLSYSIINNVSPSAFNSFSQYDLVYIGSHGAKDGSILLPIEYESLYCSKYKYTKDGKTYVNESAMAKDGISYLYSTEYFGLVKKDKMALKLDKRFLNNHLPNLSNTIICTSMCYAGRSNSQLLQSVRSKGCPEFYGADEPVEGSGVGPMSFFRNFLVLFSKGSSAKLAYEQGKRLMVKTNSKYNYNRYGNTNVTYFNPYITGVREVKDKSAILGVKFQFSLDIPGSVNSETANQYGIYLENLGQYIPLSNSNVVNQATTTLYNSVCAYYANVKIDDLTPNTNYRYRSYVIVGNKVIFSGTAESFKTNEQFDILGKWFVDELGGGCYQVLVLNEGGTGYLDWNKEDPIRWNFDGKNIHIEIDNIVDFAYVHDDGTKEYAGTINFENFWVLDGTLDEYEMDFHGHGIWKGTPSWNNGKGATSGNVNFEFTMTKNSQYIH